MANTLREVGEFGFLKRLAHVLPTASYVVEGIGDDCAVVRLGDRVLLISTDMFMEDVHFRQRYFSPENIGGKAAARALSDIAAMGGKPLFSLVSLGCPARTSVSFLERLYRGMLDVFAQYGTVVVGGDTAGRERDLILDIVVVGEALEGKYLSRKGARSGDVLCVTGALGRAGAGLYALERDIEAPKDLISAHVQPRPQIAMGQWLRGRTGVRAMIDISDGLLRDAGHLAESANLGVTVFSEKIPLREEMITFCEAQGLSAINLALTAGEDYELACGIAPEVVEVIQREFRVVFGTELYEVGVFTDDGQGVRVDGETPKTYGFQHFSSA